jgi:hypothetical protein
MAAAILCIGITWAASAGATAVTYHFTQGGFDDGATVTGTFTGADLNSDGELTYGFDPDELTAFNMQFSGNSVVPAFSLGLSDLGGFVWEINLGAYIGDDDVGRLEGIAGPLVGDVYTLYAVGPGPFHLCDDMENCGFVSTSDGEFKSFTTEPVFVNALPNSVPEPSNLGMAMFGLLALGGLLWCERRRLRA